MSRIDSPVKDGPWGRFEPREIRVHPLITHGDWRLKLYSVVSGGLSLDRAEFSSALAKALDTLPNPAKDHLRPGVGFVILHQASSASYIVRCTWDNLNELPTKVYVKRTNEPAWRPAEARESFCVWDLEIMAFERDAYILTMLNGDHPCSAKYLGMYFDKAG